SLCASPGLRMSASDAEMARQFNETQAALSRQAQEQQIELAKARIEEFNSSIRALNERVARVLNEACGAGIRPDRPDPEAGKRWLARALGTTYRPLAEGPKPTIQDVVMPLFSPTFLPVPAPS